MVGKRVNNLRALFIVVIVVGLLLVMAVGQHADEEAAPMGMAVEFTDHAACAYIGKDRGWFEEEGLKLSGYESYVTGMALAAALGRGDIEVAQTLNGYPPTSQTTAAVKKITRLLNS